MKFWQRHFRLFGLTDKFKLDWTESDAKQNGGKILSTADTKLRIAEFGALFKNSEFSSQPNFPIKRKNVSLCNATYLRNRQPNEIRTCINL